MDAELLTCLPGALDELGAGNVHHLFLHIEFYQSLGLFFWIFVLAQLLGVDMPQPLELGEPGVKRSEIFLFDWGFHSTTAVVPCNQDVGHFQNLHCVLNHSEGADVWRRSDVGNIPQNKDLTDP